MHIDWSLLASILYMNIQLSIRQRKSDNKHRIQLISVHHNQIWQKTQPHSLICFQRYISKAAETMATVAMVPNQ